MLRILESSEGEISNVADIVVFCPVEKLNLSTSTEFTRRNGIFNILNIKYIIKKIIKPKPSIMILFLWIKASMRWQIWLFLSHWDFPSVPGEVTLEVDTVLGSRLWCRGTNELSTNLSVECKLQVLARRGHPTVAVFSICSRREESNRQFASLCVCKYQLSVTVLCLIFSLWNIFWS